MQSRVRSSDRSAHRIGLQIIKVHARDSRELKLAHIAIPIEASSQTKNELYDRAKDFAFNAPRDHRSPASASRWASR